VLTELRVRNLAVIADVTLPLQSGLNVLTGETGAGKSMLVDALALLLGERASADAVRPGAQKTVVEGAFEFAPGVLRRLSSSFAALGVDADDGRLVLKREISAEGRSRAWVNASPTTVGVLVQLGALLVDLHGQHETQSLLRADAQRDILDAYADAGVERVAVRDAHGRLRDLERREQDLAAERDAVGRKADYLRHVVDEIERAAPRVGETDALDVEARRLAHADELGRLARELEQALDTAGLARAAKLFAGLSRLDPSTGRWQELLDGAFANVAELAQAARDYASGIEADPGRLATVEQRRDVLFRLARKYGPTLPDVLATLDRSARELELLETADLDLRRIAEQREAAAGEFTRACAALTAKRERGAASLAQAVNALLPALGLGGRFSVRLQSRAAHQAHGAEDVLFEVELNVGLEARPLAKVASGGELSRLMLALRVVLAGHDAVPTLVFDEVDQGIGGEVGGRVGEALAAVAQPDAGRQVLVITHLPQIAAYAHHHLVVAKGARGGVATSDVAVAVGDARTREVARMLGDPDMATALGHAAELVKKTSVMSGTRSGTPSPRGRAPRR
jgi:DNA repair protein RecN (Recombination protein N)